MPVVVKKPPPPPPPQYTANLGRAVGHCDDFYVLGYCPDLDEDEKAVDRAHRSFTFVFRFQGTARSTVGRFKLRLEDLWQPPQGPILSVGAPRGVIEIEPTGLREVALPQVNEYLMSIWGTDDAHVFVAGGAFQPIVLYRRQGQWLQIPIPDGTRPILDVRGLSEREVYFVGNDGQILLWDGQQLSRLPSPTTRHLVNLARLDDRYMCASGYDGTLLMGNKNGWRIVPTNTTAALLSIGSLDGKVYYGADDVVWSFDGASAPVVAIQTRADWVSGLADGLLLVDVDQAKLYRAGNLIDLDTII
jgi:hypothetical protein